MYINDLSSKGLFMNRLQIFYAILLLGITFFSFSNFQGIDSSSSTNPKQQSNSTQSQTNANANTNTNTISFYSSATNMSSLAKLNGNSNSWNELGPNPLSNANNVFTWGTAPFSGRVTAIAVNQSNPSIIYAGAAQGGVWRTIDGGSNWVPLMDNQSTLAIGSIAISADNKVLLVGTGEANHADDSYYSAGILRSTDEGNSWQTIGASVFSFSAISGIIINPTNDNWIVASTTYGVCCDNGLNYGYYSNGLGIFYSTDGGSTRTRTNINGGVNTTILGVSELLADPANDILQFASGYKGEIWVSQDSGKTWLSSYLTSSLINPKRVALAMSANNPNLLFYAVANSSFDLMGIYSFNIATGGVSQLANLPANIGQTYGPCNGQCWYDLIISADPDNASILYFGAVNLYRSIDGGSSWSIIGGSNANSAIHPDQHAVVYYPGNPSEIFVGNDGGIYKSADTGSTWTNLNNGLRTLQFNSIAASPTNDSVLIGGTQDNGCELYNNNTIWSLAHTGDGGSALYYNSSTILCNYANLYVEKSTNGGVTWKDSFYYTINPSDPHIFYPPMVQDPSNKATVYIGSNRLYKSTNFGDNWTDISGQISTSDISAIAVSPSNSNIIYVGDDAGIIQVSQDGGSTWTELMNTTFTYGLSYPGAIPIAISSIVIDPLDSSHIYVALANQVSPQLITSTNMGSTWTTITNLGHIPTNVAITVLKINPITHTLFLGTDRGFYFYNDTSFYALGSGLPNVAIFDFTFTYSNYLVVSTHGRGVWVNYMTPILNYYGPANNSIIQSGQSLNVTFSDYNGLNQSLYRWDTGVYNSLVNSSSLLIPTGNGLHNLT